MADIHLDQLPYDLDRLYDDPMVEVTQSSAKTFLSCQQKYVLRYLMRLVKRGVSAPLLTGSAVHKGLETLLDEKSPMPIDRRLPMALRAVDGIFEKVTEQADLMALTNDEKLETCRAQAAAILEAWYIINGSYFEGWKILQAEMKVRSVDTATIHSPIEDRMAGMIDGLVEDLEGKVWILEHKTRRSLGDLNVNTLELDFQALWYTVLCFRVLKRRHEEAEAAGAPLPRLIKPVGFLYDAIQKPQHRINQQGFDDLRRRMMEAMISDPEKYFSMNPIEVYESTIERAHKNFGRVISAMDNLRAENVIMNTSACDDWGGCPYKALCQNGADVSNPRSVFDIPQIDMYEIADRHTELESDDLDKWSGFSTT